MSLKSMLGGEVNHKFIEKQKRKELELEQDLDSKALKGWNNSKNSIEIKIKNIIDIWKDVDPDFPRRFFARHPELVPPKLNPFMKKQNTENILEKKQRYIDELIDWNTELQKENHELKIKLKKYEQSQ